MGMGSIKIPEVSNEELDHLILKLINEINFIEEKLDAVEIERYSFKQINKI